MRTTSVAKFENFGIESRKCNLRHNNDTHGGFADYLNNNGYMATCHDMLIYNSQDGQNIRSTYSEYVRGVRAHLDAHSGCVLGQTP